MNVKAEGHVTLGLKTHTSQVENGCSSYILIWTSGKGKPYHMKKSMHKTPDTFKEFGDNSLSLIPVASLWKGHRWIQKTNTASWGNFKDFAFELEVAT